MKKILFLVTLDNGRRCYTISTTESGASKNVLDEWKNQGYDTTGIFVASVKRIAELGWYGKPESLIL